jgi:cytochrome c oxidase subunit IV
MSGSSTKRIATVWLALSAITLVSWWIGSSHGRPGFRLDGTVTFAVIAIAAVKVRLIVTEFMGARQAPRLLLRLMDAWLVLLVVTLLAVYVAGTGPRAS